MWVAPKKCKRHRNRASSTAYRKKANLPTPCFQLSETNCRFLTDKTKENKFILFKASRFVVICYSRNSKLIQRKEVGHFVAVAHICVCVCACVCNCVLCICVFMYAFACFLHFFPTLYPFAASDSFSYLHHHLKILLFCNTRSKVSPLKSRVVVPFFEYMHALYSQIILLLLSSEVLCYMC